ncbi:MAG: metallophosphoesterase [Kiritimatiellia bacterium]|nr:metallophosphatase family protein [Lentisphaerota bacterium]
MKYAIVSDIHSNLHAWKAVLLDIRSSGVDRIICLGDMIGYGPHPREVLESLYANVDHFILGNHDAALCGKINTALFSEPAGEIIDWTNRQLGDSARRFMARLPLSIAGRGFRCAHANFDQPAAFHYIFEPQDALPGWEAVPEPLLFIGHTHRPGIFVIGESQTPRLIPPEDFMLEDGKRFLLNVGSVGQPRDGDSRATYCIFDTATKSIFWRKIPFDLDAYRADLQKAGLPETAAPFLNVDPRAAQQPLREMVNFSPPTTPEEAAHDTQTVQHLDVLQRRVWRWRMMFGLLMLLVLLVGGTGSWAWWRHHNRRLSIAGTEMNAVYAADHAPGSNLLEMPDAEVVPGQPFSSWDVLLGNRHRQNIAWKIEGGSGLFDLTSADGRSDCWLVSPAVHVRSRDRLMIQGFVHKGEDFQGSIALVVELIQESGANQLEPMFEVTHNFHVKEPHPNLRRADGFYEARSTFDLPARSHSVRLKVGGKFTGAALVRDLRLERRP